MNDVLIVAAQAVTALGDSLEATWDGLCAGASAIRPLSRFDTAAYVSGVAACIPELDDYGVSRVHPLLDRLLKGFGPVPANAVLITASTKWGIDALEQAARQGRAPAAADLLLQEFPAAVGRRLGLASYGCNVSAACASGTVALGRAAAAIAAGASEVAAVFCLDIVSEFVFSGFSALKGLAAAPCRPFDSGRDGLSLGEGAAAFLLMSRRRAERQGLPALAKLRGWGAAGDAHHITAPARDGDGLVRAVRAALARAGLGAHEVAGVSAHGTGTVYNDLMELTAFAEIFGGRAVPLHSVKGAIGHTLGAAGGIEAAIAVMSLAQGKLPPTTGFSQKEEGVAGLVSARPLPLAGDILLSTNSGFGGVNAALVLQGVGGGHGD